MLRKVLEGLWRLETGLVAGLMLATSVLVFAQVLTRYIFLYSVPWMEELTRFLMIWMVLLGTSVAVKQKQHIVIDLVDIIVKNPRLLAYYRIGLCLAGVVFSITLAVLSYTVVERTASYGQLSGAMRIPMYLANGSFLIASLLMIVHYLEALFTNPYSREAEEALQASRS
ncbi:TRAP transporter small permease [Pusillimonas sp. T7-7]|uniref:TRAP transporter small permease n=1 Tax=Pusillimonas sp. (strain T7-7) TaxID=1007105 RepID=UPI00059F722C|nr:TRAP transporter small permease [Pusillimonas sp. T7-7]